MRSDYKAWLEQQKYDSGTIIAQLHRVGRVEEFYGNLDEHFADGTLQSIIDELTRQKLSLERDMQAALRLRIGQLSNTLSIVDDGAERTVDSGFIDITCVDSKDDALVVVELKAGKADSRAIGQILGYMGDLAEEEEGRVVRGILVAHEFDKRSRSAARVVSTLSLVRYAIDFRFEPEE